MVDIFERFTERARQVVVSAQDESRGLGHRLIGTEHILLGILREGEGLGARVLNSFDITLDRARAEVIRICGKDDENMVGQIPFTPRAKKVLELALKEALSLGHNYIGTEHILLGLVRENEGVAARILLDLSVGPEKIRNEVIRMLSGPKTPPVVRHQYLVLVEVDESGIDDVDREITDTLKVSLHPGRPSVTVVHLDPATKFETSHRRSQRPRN